jgi:putative membrane protein
MKVQWIIIIALVFALITAILATANVGPVPLNYIFGVTDIPLILVIFGSVLTGGLIVGWFGIVRQYQLQRTIKRLERELESARNEVKEPKNTEVKASGDAVPQQKAADGDEAQNSFSQDK